MNRRLVLLLGVLLALGIVAGTRGAPPARAVDTIINVNTTADGNNSGGGAINFAPRSGTDSPPDTLVLAGDIFTNNTSQNDGGGAVNFNGGGGTLTVSNSTFTSNTSVATAVGTGGQDAGGAIN